VIVIPSEDGIQVRSLERRAQNTEYKIQTWTPASAGVTDKRGRDDNLETKEREKSGEYNRCVAKGALCDISFIIKVSINHSPLYHS